LGKAELSQSPEAEHEVTFAVAHCTVVPGKVPAVAVLLDSCKLIAAAAPVGALTGTGVEELPVGGVLPPPAVVDEVLPSPAVVDGELEPLPPLWPPHAATAIP
jgi:hypothetical protein